MKLLKKAELSINMIVIVAICIVVLVIIVYLVANTGRQADTSTACARLGGVCVDANRCDPSNLNARLDRGAPACEGVNRVCCNPLSVIG